MSVVGSIILPSLGLHTSLSTLAYATSRAAGRLEGKDWLWPSGLVASAWYHGVLQHVLQQNVSLSSALGNLNNTQKLVLGAVTLWGGRLFYRIAKRSIQRRSDDPRYTDATKTSSAWNKAFYAKFLPEAVFQTIIGLSYTIPLNGFVTSGIISAPQRYAGLWHSVAVALYAVGLGMEVIADWQLEVGKDSGQLQRSGVWSIVRHPKPINRIGPTATVSYLGDALVHFSIPILLYADSRLHPLCLFGPLANYAFLRFVGGDKENEASQEARYAQSKSPKYAQLKQWQSEKNSFWPSLKEVGNVWSVGLVLAGTAVALGERYIRTSRVL
ncbi:hypothetical protein QFC21_001585 [Naganishia friedmannii]|uniref:Uncharacterized protein n=1 Tax=Naganishia friedmannii TaxID=89922 RepID=A0ACC2W5G5_9TREE|nr:hypothetical protein QFC21_001585 [Naganishia friedmannii]